MINSISFFVGLRYLAGKRRTGFLAFVSVFALLGMILGVFSLIVVMSVMNGFDDEMKSRILKVVPHAEVVTNTPLTEWLPAVEKVQQETFVEGAAPFVSGKGLAQHYDEVRGVDIQGISLEHEHRVSDIPSQLLLGQFEDLRAGEFNIVIGSLLARNLGVTLGEKITVTLPIVSITPAGVFPRTKRFTVVGIFEVGAMVDEYLMMININDAQRLFRTAKGVHGIRLKYDDIYRSGEYSQQVSRYLGDNLEVRDWSQSQGSLFQAVKMEKAMVAFMLSIIVFVAAFNIVTSLIMMVTEKRSAIAVLRTMGMGRFGVIKIFIVQGIVLGFTGIFVGASVGVATAIYLPEMMAYIEQTFGIYIFDPNVYFVAHLPSVWQWQDTLWVVSVALILSVVATIYPAYRASLISPAEALRYDV